MYCYEMQATDPLASVLKVMADPTRLRMLALLERDELSVGELTRALGMSQSRVSNHLRILREAELLAERHRGTSTYLRSAAGASNGTSSLASELWAPLRARLPSLPEHAADLARLEGVLAARDSSSFFDRVAGEWDKIGIDFATGQARQRAAANLLPADLVLADLGCGTGYFGRALAGLCSKLICVDSSQRMLDEAMQRLERAPHGTEVVFRLGELDALPIADAELDGLVAGMVLHHLPSLDLPLAEMLRVLKPGAVATVVELMPHRESWMREEYGDRHLGLEPTDVIAAFQRAGFEDVLLVPVQDEYRPRHPEQGESEADRPALPLYTLRARKPRAGP